MRTCGHGDLPWALLQFACKIYKTAGCPNCCFMILKVAHTLFIVTMCPWIIHLSKLHRYRLLPDSTWYCHQCGSICLRQGPYTIAKKHFYSCGITYVYWRKESFSVSYPKNMVNYLTLCYFMGLIWNNNGLSVCMYYKGTYCWLYLARMTFYELTYCKGGTSCHGAMLEFTVLCIVTLFSQMFVNADSMVRCFILYTCWNGLDWNTWIQWSWGVSHYLSI